MTSLFASLPLKELILLGLEQCRNFFESCHDVGDPCITAHVLWLGAEVRIAGSRVGEVADWLLGLTQADVTDGGFRV